MEGVGQPIILRMNDHTERNIDSPIIPKIDQGEWKGPMNKKGVDTKRVRIGEELDRTRRKLMIL